jgi:hypothetical protein
MAQEKPLAAEKRFTLRMDPDLWRELRIEAAKRDLSTTEVILMLLREKLREIEGARQ